MAVVARRWSDNLAIDLIIETCRAAGNPALIEEARAGLIDFGIPKRPDRSANAAILDWLLEVVAFQGISDSVALNYMTEHGCIRSAAASFLLRLTEGFT